MTSSMLLTGLSVLWDKIMTQSNSESRKRRRFRFSLKMMLVLVTLSCIGMAVYFLSYRFTEYDDYYVELTEKVKFQGFDVDVLVILEEGRKTPTLRQRFLIYRMQRYASALRESINDAADEHRVNFEGMVGDLTEEYGLPVMNRENIQNHFWVSSVWIPRLIGSSDDYIALGCSCNWEEEHGMEMLIKNGESVEWHGQDGPWQWQAPWKFMQKKQK